MRLFRTAALLAIAVPAAAQVSSRLPVHSVAGVVFDSTQLSPLAGAIVQAVLVSSASVSTRTYTAIAGVDGRYRFDSLPAGRFAIGFQHHSLNAFGLESPLHGFEWNGDSSVTLDLSLGASAATREQLCGAPNAGANPGTLGGYVIELRRGTAPPNTKLAVQWFEVGLSKGKLTSLPHEVVATLGEGGTYLACTLPTDAPLALIVSSPGYHAIETEVTIPANRIVVRRDFTLADTSAARGTSIVVGHVTASDGAAVPLGIVSIRALNRDIEIDDGTFTITGLPGGTWSLDVRAIGYEPVSTTIVVAEASSANVGVTMPKRAQTLDVINVIGKTGRDIKVLEGIKERLRTNGGSYFGPGNEFLEHATYPADVIRQAHGFRYVSPTQVGGRDARCLSAKSNLETPTSGKGVVIYLDGVAQPGGLETITNLIPMKQILAVEAYPDITSAPALWRYNGGCAIIAIWSKKGF